MEDVASSPVNEVPSPAKSSVPVKDPVKEVAGQMNARIAGAVALVAADCQVSETDVHNTISVELGCKFAQDNQFDLVETLRNGFQRCVAVTELVRNLAQKVGVDYSRAEKCADWVSVYDAALRRLMGPLTAMTDHFQAVNKQEQGTNKPRPSMTEMEQHRLSAFKINPEDLKASRNRAKQSCENKAREKKVQAAREKSADTVDAAAQKRLALDNDDDDDDDDVSIEQNGPFHGPRLLPQWEARLLLLQWVARLVQDRLKHRLIN